MVMFSSSNVYQPIALGLHSFHQGIAASISKTIIIDRLRISPFFLKIRTVYFYICRYASLYFSPICLSVGIQYTSFMPTLLHVEVSGMRCSRDCTLLASCKCIECLVSILSACLCVCCIYLV